MLDRAEPCAAGDEVLVVDGARFHLVWLRDNCPCAACQDPGTWQKLFDVTATDLAPRARSAALDAGALCVVWDEEPPHRSRYPRGWLRRHAYDVPARAAPPEPFEPWQAATWAPAGPAVRDAGDPAWQADVRRYGFALLGGLDQAAYEALLRATGPVTPTEFGPVAPLIARPDPSDLGETGAALAPHTDYTVYMDFPPTLSFLHCLRNDSDGGESLLVDGFAAAAELRERDPAAFALLARTPLPFHQVYPRWRFHHKRLRPTIELDRDGAVCGVHVGHPHTRNWRLPFDRMLPFYRAYAAFVRMLDDPARQLRRRLQAGECLAFRNVRVLHGRTAFTPGSGARHLQIAYVNWSYVTARARFARRHER